MKPGRQIYKSSKEADLYPMRGITSCLFMLSSQKPMAARAGMDVRDHLL
jgi:hypothetical protein